MVPIDGALPLAMGNVLFFFGYEPWIYKTVLIVLE